jgi:plasmid stabilization system protein ParE
MARRLVFSRAAYQDIERIVEFNNYRNQSDSYAEKFVNGLLIRLKKLLPFPYAGEKTDIENQYLLVWDDFYIFYRFDSELVLVSKIYHQKEDV